MVEMGARDRASLNLLGIKYREMTRVAIFVEDVVELCLIFSISEEIRFCVKTRVSLSVRCGLAECTRLDR